MKKGNNSTNTVMSADKLRDMAFAFRESRILLTAYELGIFTLLEGKSKTSQEISEILETDPRATDRLMDALCAMGLLIKKNNKFWNSVTAGEYLVKGKPAYLSNLMHSVHLWDAWSTLTEAVRHGGSVSSKEIKERGDTWLQAFIAAMHQRAVRQAPATVSLLDLSGVKRVLDVGGGSGAFAMAFARADENITATVFDLPAVVPLTCQYIEAEGLQKKVRTRPGDYMNDPLGNGYDLIFLSAIVHSNSPEQNTELIGKCTAALNSGGSVVVQDFVMDEDRTRPAQGALFSLNMLVGTETGDTYTEGEIRGWMETAGLSGITRQETPFGVSMIIGRKK